LDATSFRTWKRLRPARRARGERGLALLATAIVLMVVTLLLAGIAQFGYVFYVHRTMMNAARDAARAAAVGNASAGAAASVAQGHLSGLPLAFDVHVQIPNNVNSINRDVRVLISTPMRGLSFGLVGGGDLQAQATMRRGAD
jgi:hypothetical protein